MAEEELQLDVTQAKGSKMTNILLIVLIVLVLVMGGVGAWFFLAKDDKSGADTEHATKVEKAPLHYLTLTPEFVVNFGPGSKVRYLQIDLQVASRDEHALATMTTYMPVIRNDILVLLSGQSFDDLKSIEGKNMLQKKILNTLNSILSSVTSEENHGEKKDEPALTVNAADGTHNTGDNTEHSVNEGPVENVYFTSFIMQ